MEEKLEGKKEGPVSPEAWKEYQRQRWIDASSWNPDDFETHPADPRFSRGKEPPEPREG